MMLTVLAATLRHVQLDPSPPGAVHGLMRASIYGCGLECYEILTLGPKCQNDVP